jgi:hypothetical protein
LTWVVAKWLYNYIELPLFLDIVPKQFIVKQAREKVRKLVEEMDEIQNVELMRFGENMDNNSNEFCYKQQAELESFMGNLNASWETFLQKQENDNLEFSSMPEMRKSIFLSMQKETQEEFYANEEYLRIKFQEKQFDEFTSLQMREECKSLTARKSISSCPTWDSQWGYLSGKTEHQLENPVQSQKENSIRRNSAPICSQLSSPVGVNGSYLTCPAEVPNRKLIRQNMMQMNNQTPSPVPSLEYVGQNKEYLKETQPPTIHRTVDEEEIKVRQTKPIVRTPKLSRKSTLDILREEEEKDCACKDDPEILSITRKAIVANRFPSPV